MLAQNMSLRTLKRSLDLLSMIPLVTMASAAVSAQTSSTIAQSEAGSQKPNVVLFYTDDLGYGDLSCYGATHVKTPNIDKIATSGLQFTNGRCAAATCTPSRFSILTGQYPWRKQGTGILPGDASLIIPTDRATLGKVFQNAGYRTGAIGKWHVGLGPQGGPDWNGDVKPGPNEVGFDYSFIFPATADRVPTVYVKNHKVVALDPADPIATNYEQKIGNEPTGKENPDLLKLKSVRGHDNTIVNGIGRIGWMTGGQRARWVDEALGDDFTAEATDFIERNRENPFFLYYAIHDIHVPRMPSTRYKGQSPLGLRGDAILEMDAIVGEVMHMLETAGLTTNTLVIFSSDNGPILNDGYDDQSVELNDGHRPAGPFRGTKYSILEGGTRVPFLVSWPAQIAPGKSDALVSQVDFVRSFAEMFGQKLNAGDAPDSQNMIEALLGKKKIGRDSVVVSSKIRALVKGDWKYIEPVKGSKKADAERGYSKQPQLFNLATDPEEQRNAADKNPEILKQMRAELKAIERDGGVEQ